MIRILVCDPDSGERSQLRSAVDLLVSAMKIGNYGISYVTKLDDMVGLVKRMRTGFHDIIVCRATSGSAEALNALREVRDADGGASIVIASDTQDFAAEAFDLQVDGYCLFSEGRDGFERAMKVPILKAASKHTDTIALRTDQGTGNFPIDAIMFVEASKRGSLVHLPEGKTVLARGTLQSLFEQLGEDERFIKAGSSFIVNLDNVRSLGEGSIIFPDGEAIIVPVRARKPVKDALIAYRLRPEFATAALAG